MKHFLIIFLMVLCPFTISASEESKTSVKKNVGANTGVGNLIINVTGFENNDGGARIAIVNSKVNYDESNNHRQKVVPVKNKEAQCIVEDLEFGEYAVKVFHDENSNEELDKAMFGIPKEAYGFSNNARGKFGAPAYSKVAFKFDASDQEIFIKVK